MYAPINMTVTEMNWPPAVYRERIAELEKAIAQMHSALTEIRHEAATMQNGGAWAAGVATLCLGTLPKSVANQK